ncbi:mechanosensitive ion channel [Candidatus Dependentiae bacterium]|nr:mechanosensitive ion channel [Candidatus Dependentiae bacterium]
MENIGLEIFTLNFLIKLTLALGIMILARIFINSITPSIHSACTKNNLDHHSCIMITKIMRYIINIFFGAIALQNLGLDLNMFFALFGITGIVLSYGMKDIVANFIASILILGYKYIKINDYIKTKDWQGRVIDINLRYTTIEYDNMTILIPNIVLYTNPIAIIKE